MADVVRHRALDEDDKVVKAVDFFLFDVTGGVFEYQITEPLGPNTTHSKARARTLQPCKCMCISTRCSRDTIKAARSDLPSNSGKYKSVRAQVSFFKVGCQLDSAPVCQRSTADEIFAKG